ncbi:MAG: putative Ig domain-containing protein, partial [Acidobacteria bacterium]|nr:putative Ig domain-containing protein [Acidobacteriota bacterium]
MAGKRLYAAISVLVLAVLVPGALPAQAFPFDEGRPLELPEPASAPAESAWANGGGISAWGGNGSGQSNVPADLKSVVAVAGGGFHSLALRADGTVAAWGENNHGQVNVPAGLTGVAAIAAGGYFSMALKGDGTVVAWGENDHGETTVPAGLTGVKAIAAGLYFAAALKDDGTVVAWGNNSFGQLNIPAGLTGVTTLACGGFHTLAVKADGTVAAWGYNGHGELNVPAGLTGVVAVSAGYYHSVALKADGTVAAWGDNSNGGQLNVPAGLNGVAAISAGIFSTVALKADGTVVAWGNNSSGQSTVPAGLNGVTAIAAGAWHVLALRVRPTSPITWGDNTFGQTTVPAGLTGVAAVAGGGAHTLALMADGTVAAWGRDDSGQATVPAGLTGVTAIAAGRLHSLALKADGTAAAWGDNTYNQSTIPAGLTGATAVAGGGGHSLVLKADGTVTAWGRNDSGQATVPAGLTSVTSVAAGRLHSLAVKADGTVAAWGNDTNGQSTVPAGLTGVVAVSAGNAHSVALKADGTVAAWGDDTDGQSTVPAGLTGVVAISAGNSSTVALKADGTLVAWGDNASGQTAVPSGLVNVAAMAAGYSHVVALDGIVILSPASLATGTAGLPYPAVSFTQAGGVGAISWAESGALPSGMTFSAGTLSGTPTAAGSFPFTVTATDANGYQGSRAYTLVINAQANLAVTKTDSPDPVTAGQNITYTINLSNNGPSDAQTVTVTDAVPTNTSFVSATVTTGSGWTVSSPPVGWGTGNVVFSKPTVAATETAVFRIVVRVSTLVTTGSTVTNTATAASATTDPIPGNNSATTGTLIVCPSISVSPMTLSPGTAGMPYGPVTFTQTGGAGTITWSVTGGLPTGLTLDPATGVLSGTPTQTGSFALTFRAMDVNGCEGFEPISLGIGCSAIVVSPSSLAPGTAGTAYPPVTFTQTGGVGAITWSATGVLPVGMTFDPTTATLSGTPVQPGGFTINVTATDALDCSAMSSPTLTINCPDITVWPASLPNGTAGEVYPSVTFSQTGGVGTITWSAMGTLPTGMTFDPATGVLAGAPTQTGGFTFTVTVTDGSGCQGSREYTLTIDCPTLTISPPSLAPGMAGVEYGPVNFTQTGGVGAITWSATGTLPPGLTLESSGLLHGTPTTSTGSPFTFTVKATDANACTNSQAYSLTIDCPTVVTNLDDAGEGSLRWVVAYACNGATITFAPGLTGSITLATGAIPITRGLTISGPGAGVLAVDGAGLDRVFHHTAGTLVISGLTIQNGAAPDHGGGIYSSAPLSLVRCIVSGNKAWFTLPNAGGGGIYAAGGLTLDGCTISGNRMQGGGYGGGVEVNITPYTLTNTTISGNYSTGAGAFTAANTTGTVLNCTITNNSSSNYNTNPAGLVAMNGAIHLKNTIVAGNASLNQYALFGATLDDQGGNLLSGDPGVAPLGDYGGPTPTHALLCGSPALEFGTAGYPATDQRLVARPQGGAADSGAFEANIFLGPAGLPVGQAGVAYDETLTATNGTAPYAFTTTDTLPPGLSLALNGQIAGTPTALGSWTFLVAARDANGFVGVCRYTLDIACPAITVTNPAVATGTAGVPFSQAFSQAGGLGTVTFTTGSTLPAGLTLATDGTLAGTPTVTGTFPITVTVTDSNLCTGTGPVYTLVVGCQAITVANPTVATGTAGTPFSQSFTQAGAIGTATFTTGSALPAGLTLASNGTLAGTPTVTGTFPITVTVTDSNLCTGTGPV